MKIVKQVWLTPLCVFAQTQHEWDWRRVPTGGTLGFSGGSGEEGMEEVWLCLLSLSFFCTSPQLSFSCLMWWSQDQGCKSTCRRQRRWVQARSCNCASKFQRTCWGGLHLRPSGKTGMTVNAAVLPTGGTTLPHLDFRLLASQTVRQYVPVV